MLWGFLIGWVLAIVTLEIGRGMGRKDDDKSR
jgi:hypothetical protein